MPTSIKTWVRNVRNFGLIEGSRLSLAAHSKRTIPLTPPGLKWPMQVRLGTSDLQVFQEIFQTQVYRLHALWKIMPAFDAKFIADCGAYTGYSSVYFSHRFPQAKVWAIEPADENFCLLTENVRPYPQIMPIQKAVWHRRVKVDVQNPTAEKWGFEFTENSDAADATETITVAEIVRAAGGWIDILKIDIEGAERDIFSQDCSWIDQVGILIIELHDGIRPGCSRAFWRQLIDRDFCMINQHENLVLVNEKLLIEFRTSQAKNSP